ncbi:hypothetical protein QJQ45_005381 [Haematococcus lacustris]|nr:hypothetical protein QJQ45_005381 [Haematococcus lacustris]
MASASGHITDVSLASDYPDSEFESDTLLFESMLAITPLEGSVAGSCHAPCTLPSPDSTWLFRSAWTRGALAVAAAEAKHTAQPQPGSQLVAPVQPLPLATVLVLAGSEVSLDILQTAEVATLSAGAADQLGFCEAEVFDLAMGAALTMQRRAVGRLWQLVGRSSAREQDLQEVLCCAQPLVSWANQAGGLLDGPGERQAAPAAAGYAVILLHRRGSVQPFTSHLPASTVLDLVRCCLELNSQSDPNLSPNFSSHPSPADQDPSAPAPPSPPSSSPAEAKHVRVVAAYQQVLADSLSAAVASDQTGVLLSIPFETIFDYLQRLAPFTYRPPATAAAAQCLRSVALALAPCGAQVLFYLAAAVSDFYLPWAELAEHKIQSSEGGLDLQLRKVPKMLGLLTRQWCPGAMVVSFKLETDTHILVAKVSL